MATVKLRYDSSSNITFHGEVDTGIEREEWEEMTENMKIDAISEELFNLVDIYEIEEDEGV